MQKTDASTDEAYAGEDTYRALFDNLLNGVAYCRMIYEDGKPVDFRYLGVNAAFAVQTGFDSAIGRLASELIPGLRETDAELLRIYGRVAANGHPERFEYYLVARRRWLSVSVYCPHAGHFVTIFDVITERKQVEAALLESERRLNRVIEGSEQGFWDWDLQTNAFTVSPRFEAMVGYAPGEMDARVEKWGEHVHPDDLAKAFVSIERHLAGETPVHEVEVRCRAKSGEWCWILTRGRIVERDSDGRPMMMSGTFTDVSSIRASQERLEFLARHDPLTHLPNRPMLFSHLERAMAVTQRGNSTDALLLIDLDHFKDVNDSFGHLIGDNLLLQAAQRLKTRQRDGEMLVRLGGDEFAVWLEGIARPEDAGRIAGDIIALLEAPWFLPNDAEVHVSGSIGIALYPGPANSPEELLQQADAAMYRAKKEGRARYQFFSEDLTDNARRRIAMESQLRHAIDEGELELHFQPLIDIGSGLTVGAEALVRWNSPEAGLVTPNSFIPLAEETGLILPLGRWVLRETCRIGRAWIDAGRSPLLLAVNVSARQLHFPGFADEVLAILAETRFPEQFLEIEITESSLMSGLDQIVPQLQKLRANDIRLAIDDFGTGYSSLAYLKRFPLDVLKIDRSFIEHLAQRKDDREIVTAIIQMGHTLGFRVVAEGVETVEQLAYLKEKGCDIYQGYLASRPLPVSEFEALPSRPR